MAERSAPATPAATSQMDASAQTETVVIMSEADYFKAVRESKSDVALSTAAKQGRQNQRPVTTKTQQPERTGDAADRAWKTRSFEDYLNHAQAELSELGSVITANEALFAQKIQEHVGDLQRAKDQLASEYTNKFDTLLAEKEKMERDVSAKTAADFAQERKKLVASYGADHEEPAKQAAAVTKLPSSKRNALRTAEERLVSEYNRRIVKRKSQIAMKHAEDYQTLAQDYDKRIAELLGNREALESDLSVEPSKFEKDLDQFEVMSAQLETEKANSAQNSPASKRPSRELLDDTRPTTGKSTVDTASGRQSQLPKRTLTSTPRTPTSIPRALPFPANRESIDAPAPHRSSERPTDARRSVSERHPPVRRESLMRTKSPPDAAIPKHIASNPRGSEKVPSQFARSKFSVEPSETEQKASPQPQESARLSSPQTLRPPPNKRKSLRHSSRIIYGDYFHGKEI